MPKTISFHNGIVWSRGHNARDERYVKKQKHIDTSLTANNVIVCDVPVRQAYEEIFGQAVQEYNSRQKRADRRINCYYDKIKQDKRKHIVYECIVQIGDKDDTGNSAELEKQALIRFAKEWNERNPNLYLIGAYVHTDEPNGTVHLHCDYIPVAECSRGMTLQNSYDRALQQQGFKSENVHQTAQIAWQDSEREALCAICRELNIDVQRNQGIGKGREYLTPQEYKRAKNKMVEQIGTELQPLKDELEEYRLLKISEKAPELDEKKLLFQQRISVPIDELETLKNRLKHIVQIEKKLKNSEIRKLNLISSSNSLMNVLKVLMIQRLEQRVQQLTEQNEMLNESDLQMKKAEELQNRLKEKEKHWKNEVKKYQEEALNAEKRADTAILQANNEKEEVIKRKSEYDKLIANQKKVVKEKAEQMNEQYRNRCQFIWLVVLLYNVLATIFTGYQSERVVADCAGAVMAIKNLCVNGFLKIVDLSEKVGSIVDKIEQSIASEIVSTLLNLIVFMAIPCGVLALLYFVGKFVMNVYKENCFDEISLFVVTVTIAVLVWFADFMPLNIILMLILSHILYIVVRWYVKSYKENHC